MQNSSIHSFDSLMDKVWSISEEVGIYIGSLYKHGLANAVDKQQIQTKVKDMVLKGLSREQILDEFSKEHEILGPGDILICNRKLFIVDNAGKHIIETSLDNIVNILGDRLKDVSGKKFVLSMTRSTLRGAYVDGKSIWSSGYNVLKIICTHRRYPVRTVCSTSLFNSGEHIKAYLYDGMLVNTIKKRIYRYVKPNKYSQGVKPVLEHIKNPMDIPGMLQATNIIGRGPTIEFSRETNSDTKYFDFITVEFGLSYNGRTYKEQIEYIKKCIKAFDTLATTAIKHNKTFINSGAKLSYFQVEKVLSRQNILIYTFSLKIKLDN